MSEIHQNDNLVLVSGLSSTGKSACLMNINNPEGVMYLNTEGKKLPFRSKFEELQVTDPLQIFEAFDVAETEGFSHIHTIVIDTLTFMMDMYETQYVLSSTNTMKAWGDYGQFFKKLMLEYVSKSSKNVILLGHVKEVYSEDLGVMAAAVPIKGALANNGIEAYFSTVISTKKVQLKELKDYGSDMLNVTEEEELLGFKYVFQTKLTKKTVAERIRAPLGMWGTKETFIDNDIQFVLNRLHEYYNS